MSLIKLAHKVCIGIAKYVSHVSYVTHMNSTNMAAGKTAATTLSEQHGEIVERLLKLYSILDTRKLEGDDRDYWLISREIAWENYQLAALYAKMHGALGDVTTV